MGRGFFESEDDYQSRISREANERRIQDATGEKPSQGWLESDESYQSRIGDEANKATIANATGESPTQGWFESDSSFRERIASEANKAVIEDVTGYTPDQGWLESDDDYQHRLRAEANRVTLQRESGEMPSQGLFESDSDFRARVSLAAREHLAGRGAERQSGSGSAPRSRGGQPTASNRQSNSSTSGVVVAVAVVVCVAAFVMSSTGNEGDSSSVSNLINNEEINEPVSSDTTEDFRSKLSTIGDFPLKYDEGSFDNLEGDVYIYDNLSDYLNEVLGRSQDTYRSFSEPGSCQNAIGPISQSDLTEILQDKIGLIRNPINNKIEQLYFSGHAKTSSGRVCHFGSLQCPEVYACLDSPARIYVGGVSSVSDDEIISLARPSPEYFLFDDFRFALTQCDQPNSTYRRIEINLSPQLSSSIISDQSIASELLGIVLTRAANLCPIKEKRPLVPTAHPLSNMEVTAIDPLGNQVFEVRTNQNGGW